jgi:hypothetical protein
MAEERIRKMLAETYENLSLKNIVYKCIEVVNNLSAREEKRKIEQENTEQERQDALVNAVRQQLPNALKDCVSFKNWYPIWGYDYNAAVRLQIPQAAGMVINLKIESEVEEEHKRVIVLAKPENYARPYMVMQHHCMFDEESCQWVMIEVVQRSYKNLAYAIGRAALLGDNEETMLLSCERKNEEEELKKKQEMMIPLQEGA